MHRPPPPIFKVYIDILGFSILLKYEDNFFYKLSFKISEWSCEKFGNEIDLETVKKEELNDLLRWFYAEVQPKEKENKKPRVSQKHNERNKICS